MKHDRYSDDRCSPWDFFRLLAIVIFEANPVVSMAAIAIIFWLGTISIIWLISRFLLKH